MGVQAENFGITKDGRQVQSFILTNNNGMQAVVLEYGAILQKLLVPDRNGGLRDVVWGFEELEGYEFHDNGCLGAVIGRNANRIKGAEFSIGERRYSLEPNEKGNNLHGGAPGYHKRIWEGCLTGESEVTFLLESPDGDQGFPGKLHVLVTYRLTDENELILSYRAKCDQDTIVNLTNHSYFNLDGQSSDSVLDHSVWIDADAFTPTDETWVPTGEIRSVEGTPLDFRCFEKIGARIQADYEPLILANGYDHNFVLNHSTLSEPCAKMKSDESGILMEVFTSLPGVQFYTGNFLNPAEGEKGEHGYCAQSAACFETQFFPDAVHHPEFKSSVLPAGETYHAETIYRFMTI